MLQLKADAIFEDENVPWHARAEDQQHETHAFQDSRQSSDPGLSELRSKIRLHPDLQELVQLDLDHPGRRLYYRCRLQERDKYGYLRPRHLFVLDNYIVISELVVDPNDEGTVQYVWIPVSSIYQKQAITDHFSPSRWIFSCSKRRRVPEMRFWVTKPGLSTHSMLFTLVETRGHFLLTH